MAIASLLGVSGFALLILFFHMPPVISAIAAIAAIGITFVFRMLAVRFDWKTTAILRKPQPDSE